MRKKPIEMFASLFCMEDSNDSRNTKFLFATAQTQIKNIIWPDAYSTRGPSTLPDQCLSILPPMLQISLHKYTLFPSCLHWQKYLTTLQQD